MSFRVEEKLLINEKQILDFKKFLHSRKAKKIFPSRKVRSLYFENFKDEMYSDSLEGIVPRKKIRVRNYPNDKNSYLYLEVKISSPDGRYKTRRIISENQFDSLKEIGIYDNQYGACRPIIYITYDREYYQIDDVRISIDENIKYNLFSGRELSQHGNNPIVELKTSIKKDRDDLLNAFPFPRTRFSKYCNAFEKV